MGVWNCEQRLYCYATVISAKADFISITNSKALHIHKLDRIFVFLGGRGFKNSTGFSHPEG